MAGNDEVLPEPKAVARNLRILMRWHGWNQSELSRRSGVSQRHISDLLRGLSDCTTERLEEFARALRVPSWTLLMDDLTEDLLTSTALQIIVETYVKNPAGRKLISGAADMVRDAPKR
jgi:transcriptional regulator with XRE-family HTH domain